jgi:hypothetical protein
MGGKSEGWEKRVSEKGQNEFLVWRTMDISTGEGGRVKGMRIGMRR